MSRIRKKQHHDEHVDEAWLIPYADILTLLLALFIVLFATSKVDQQKLEELSTAFNIAFSGNVSILDGKSASSIIKKENDSPKYNIENNQLLKTKQLLDQYILDEHLTAKLETELLDEGLAIRIRETVLFPSGSASLFPESRKIASDVSRMIEPLPQKIIVSGHTDNIPINNSEFQSNWDLGTRRSLNFLKLLFNLNPQLKPERFVVAGYSEYTPVADNMSEDGRAKNRRVEILILRSTKSPQ